LEVPGRVVSEQEIDDVSRLEVNEVRGGLLIDGIADCWRTLSNDANADFNVTTCDIFIQSMSFLDGFGLPAGGPASFDHVCCWRQQTENGVSDTLRERELNINFLNTLGRMEVENSRWSP